MITPEDIPEDRCLSYPCDCGGNIIQDTETREWRCDTCGFSPSKNKDRKEDRVNAKSLTEDRKEGKEKKKRGKVNDLTY